MIRYGIGHHKETRIQQTESFRSGGWVSAVAPTQGELEDLAKRFHLELGHLTDALDPNEVPRFEEEGDCAYLYTRVPVVNGDTYSTVPVLFILHPSAVITVTRTPLGIFEKLMDGSRSVHRTDRIGLFMSFFNDIVLQYNSAISRINKLTITTSVNIDQIQNRDIVGLVGYEQILNEFLNAIIQTNAFLRGFSTNRKYFVHRTDRDLIEDLFLATGQLIELSKSSLHQARNIRDAYSTIMTNNLNRVIKFFTALTIVFTIPMIIASFYGMNVRLPLADHPYAFLFVAGLTIVLSFGLLLFLFRRRWL